ncbi:hypothetical protein DFH09DRAFT_1370072 [Mycena vulgaris]|nr:hypothetical protein DFH09DRAFT_1370072 [Mycena vulgaris]
MYGAPRIVPSPAPYRARSRRQKQKQKQKQRDETRATGTANGTHRCSETQDLQNACRQDMDASFKKGEGVRCTPRVNPCPPLFHTRRRTPHLHRIASARLSSGSYSIELPTPLRRAVLLLERASHLAPRARALVPPFVYCIPSLPVVPLRSPSPRLLPTPPAEYGVHPLPSSHLPLALLLAPWTLILRSGPADARAPHTHRCSPFTSAVSQLCTEGRPQRAQALLLAPS